MSNTIENRVVQMEFEHKEFEKSIDKSIDALDKFDDRLGDFAGSVQQIDKSISFKGLQNAIDSVTFDNITEGAVGTQSSFDDVEKRMNEFSNSVKELNKDTNFDSIQKSINNLSFSSPLSGLRDLLEGIQEFAEQVKIGFEREIGANLANKLTSMIKSLSLDQISEGFDKYTASTKDIVAIMNQANMSMEDVEDRVEKLAWYSDATSYSYTAMVQALKNFVAQGIDMDTAISMIMGMGNSLSYAGLAAEEASSAFQIYSKAMGQGYVSQIQWKSLNLMSASTKNLKQQFIDAAVELGRLKQTGDGTYETLEGLEVTISNFETTLSALKGKWLDTAVMQAVFSVDYGDYTTQLYEYSKANDNLKLSITDQMAQFDAATNGIDEFGKKSFLAAQQARTFAEAINAVKDAASTIWKDVFVQVFGNAEEATEMWGNFSGWLYDIFIPPLLQISNLLRIWKDAGGRDELLNLFTNLSNVLTSITTPIKNAYTAIFGPITDLDLVGPTRTLRLFVESLEISAETGSHLQSIFESVFSIIKQGTRVVGLLGDVFGKLVKLLSPIIDIVVALADYFISIVTGVLNVEHAVDSLSGGIYRLDKGLIAARDAIRDWATKVNDFVEANLQPAVEFVDIIWGKLKNIDNFIYNMFSSWENLITTIVTAMAGLLETLNVGNIFGDVSIPTEEWINIGKNAIAGLKAGFEEGYKSLIKYVGKIFSSIIEKVEEIFDINSPSRVFFEIALMIIAGVVSGLALGKKEIADKISEILNEAKDIISENLTTILDAIGTFISTLASTLLAYIPKIGEWIFNVADQVLGYVVEGLSKALSLISKYIPLIISDIYNAVKDLITLLAPVLANIDTLIRDVLSNISNWLFSAISTVLTEIDKGLKLISDFLLNDVTISESLRTIFSTVIDDVVGLMDTVVTKVLESLVSILSTIEQNTKSVVERILGVILSIVNTLSETVPDIATAITNLMVAIVRGVNSSAGQVLDAFGGLLLTVSSWLKTSGGEVFLEAFGNILTIVFKFARIKLINSLAKLFSSSADAVGSGNTLLGTIGESFKNFFSSLASSFNPTAFAQSLSAIADAFKSFSKEAPSKVIKSIAVALLAVAVSMLIISKLNYDQVATGFAMVTGAIIELVLAVTSFDGLDMDGVSKVILSMSVALLVLILAISKLSKVIAEGGDISFATTAVLGLFLGIIGIIQSFGELKKTGSVGDTDLIELSVLLTTLSKVIIRLSIALIVFAVAAKLFNGVDVTNTIIALASLVITLVFLATAMNTFKDADFNAIGNTFLKIATSLAIFAIAAKLLEGADLTNVIIALAGIILSISFLAVVLGNFSSADMTNIGTAITGLAAALLIMAVACAAFTLVSWESMAKAGVVLVALIGVLALFSATGGFLSKGINFVTKFAKAMLIMAAAILAVSLALTLLTVSLSILSVIGAAAITAAVAALDVLLIGLLGLSDTLVQLVTMIIGVILEAIQNNAQQIVDTAIDIFMLLISAIAVVEPILLTTIDALVRDVITLVIKLLNYAADSVLGLLAQILTGIAEVVFTFLSVDLVGGLLESLTSIIDQTIDFLLTSVDKILTAIDDLILLIKEHAESIVPDLSATISEIIELVLEAAVDVIVGFVDSLFQAFIDLFNGLAEVINSRGDELADAIANLVEAIFNLFGDLYAKAWELGKNIVQGLIDGLKDIELGKKLSQGASTLWKKIQGTFTKESDMHSPSKKMYQDGAYIVEGLVRGINENAVDAENAASKLAKSVLKASEIAEDVGVDNTFTITPVLDLSRVQNGANSISNMLSGQTLNANINGISGNIYKPEFDLLDEIRQIKLTMPEETEQLDARTMVDIMRDALNGAGVYMDRDKVGKLVTTYQANTRRAAGAV